MLFTRKPAQLPTRDTALPGRDQAIATASAHFISGRDLLGAVPDGLQEVIIAMGCFWGAERVFWEAEGIYLTQVGYAGGITPNPTYEETCSGRTGHTEVVRVVFDPGVIALDDVLKLFWEGHDPTQGMRQGNDAGTQYRSAIYTTSASQMRAVLASRDAYQSALNASGQSEITTEIKPLEAFYHGEDYHQQYLAKNPSGYCGIGGTGVVCPMPSSRQDGV